MENKTQQTKHGRSGQLNSGHINCGRDPGAHDTRGPHDVLPQQLLAAALSTSYKELTQLK
jgi:organic hydroperoxide reductase OsmC/OhrA